DLDYEIQSSIKKEKKKDEKENLEFQDFCCHRSVVVEFHSLYSQKKTPIRVKIIVVEDT
ncbi:unnamed protein product, partial [Heterotrigona itama]